jgi:transcriptional regulator with XRE-family HTH domain
MEVKDMMIPKELFGARLKSLRENKGWTQEYLAEKMDISTNYLSSIERGKENPTFDMLIKFSLALKVDMWELFDFEHEVNSKELRDMLNKLSKEVNEEKLMLAVRVLRAMVR